jgi:poly(beta-D-mannuronate) lyase
VAQQCLRRAVVAVAAGLLCVMGVTAQAALLPRAGTVFPAPRLPHSFVPAAPAATPAALRPVTVIAPEEGHGSDRRVEPMTWLVMTGVGRHLRGEATGAAVLDALDLWAESRALEELRPAGPGGSLARSRYTLKRALLPLIAGYAVLRRDLDPPPDRRQRIEAWLRRLVELARPADGPITALNNHRYMRDAILVAWGALTGDRLTFDEGVAGVRDALAAMRPDGAWPLEADRGPKALFYQRHAIASLVAAAEVAVVQEVDLYAPDATGRSLHVAVRYLLDGIARGDSRQDLSFLRPRGNGRHYMAWAKAYLARFPDHPNAARLRLLIQGAPLPLIDDYTGGDVAALVGAVTSDRPS